MAILYKAQKYKNQLIHISKVVINMILAMKHYDIQRLKKKFYTIWRFHNLKFLIVS